VSDTSRSKNPTVLCADFREQIQEYLDGSLPKSRSLELFLHLRVCATCQAQLEEMKRIFHLLDTLPAAEIPADFNEKVLSAVPYQGYKEMAPLRRERVPVFLEEEFLPAVVRAVPFRLSGMTLAIVATAGLVSAWLPDSVSLVVVAGVLPEALVRLQRIARRLTVALRRSENG